MRHADNEDQNPLLVYRVNDNVVFARVHAAEFRSADQLLGAGAARVVGQQVQPAEDTGLRGAGEVPELIGGLGSEFDAVCHRL